MDWRNDEAIGGGVEDGEATALLGAGVGGNDVGAVMRSDEELTIAADVDFVVVAVGDDFGRSDRIRLRKRGQVKGGQPSAGGGSGRGATGAAIQARRRIPGDVHGLARDETHCRTSGKRSGRTGRRMRRVVQVKKLNARLRAAAFGAAIEDPGLSVVATEKTSHRMIEAGDILANDWAGKHGVASCILGPPHDVEGRDDGHGLNVGIFS